MGSIAICQDGGNPMPMLFGPDLCRAERSSFISLHEVRTQLNMHSISRLAILVIQFLPEY